MVLLEAMAAGLPIISTNGKGNTDILNDGYNGYIIDSFDVKKYVLQIKYLSEKPEVIKIISANAQDYALKFDIKDYVDSLLKLYN